MEHLLHNFRECREYVRKLLEDIITEINDGIAPNEVRTAELAEKLSQLWSSYQEIRALSGEAEDGKPVDAYFATWEERVKAAETRKNRGTLQRFLHIACRPYKENYAAVLRTQQLAAQEILKEERPEKSAVEPYSLFLEILTDDSRLTDDLLDVLESAGFSRTLTTGLARGYYRLDAAASLPEETQDAEKEEILHSGEVETVSSTESVRSASVEPVKPVGPASAEPVKPALSAESVKDMSRAQEESLVALNASALLSDKVTAKKFVRYIEKINRQLPGTESLFFLISFLGIVTQDSLLLILREHPEKTFPSAESLSLALEKLSNAGLLACYPHPESSCNIYALSAYAAHVQTKEKVRDWMKNKAVKYFGKH